MSRATNPNIRLRTRFCDVAGVEFPIANAGMSYVAQADLVVAVAEAGGFGVLGGMNLAPEELGDAIDQIRAGTSKPFGVDLAAARRIIEPDPDFKRRQDRVRAQLEERGELRGELANYLDPERMQAQIHVALSKKVPVFVSALGDPSWMVPEATRAGVDVWAIVGTPRQALRVVAGGAKVVVAQGSEGGGHTGRFGTIALVRQVVANVDVPVLAAGGIVDGRGLAAALCLGADGAWMGTRFITAKESAVHPAYVERIIAAEGEDTVVTKSLDGGPTRVLRNAWTESWADRENDCEYPEQIAVAAPLMFSGMEQGDPKGAILAGQAVGLVRDSKPAAAIINEVMAEARDVLQSLMEVLGR
jgi:NAD(P)H-dependent flavin oxidoreductase YrpB (nitropropane dioxygenase family)